MEALKWELMPRHWTSYAHLVGLDRSTHMQASMDKIDSDD
jgi:hypothetical protein